MKKFFKTVFIVGLCGVGTIALAHAVLGKHRTRDAARALQQMAQSEVDELIARQKDLKKELSELRNEYPKQIAVVKSQLRQVDRRLDELDTEAGRASDIVRLCEEDISFLEDQRDVVGSVYTDAPVIEHRGARYTSDEAGILITRISETREIYVLRLDEIEQERRVLHGEKDQLTLELHAIEAERQEFEAEYQSLLREIERLERNQELLKIAEARRGIGADRHGEAMNSLNEVKTAVERARIEQEERLKSARVAPRSLDYETRARLLELQRKREAKQKTERVPEADEAMDGSPEEEPELEVELSTR
jgi:chromosome segregation ATPase